MSGARRSLRPFASRRRAPSASPPRSWPKSRAEVAAAAIRAPAPRRSAGARRGDDPVAIAADAAPGAAAIAAADSRIRSTPREVLRAPAPPLESEPEAVPNEESNTGRSQSRSIILPGESLAKYRGVSAPARSACRPRAPQPASRTVASARSIDEYDEPIHYPPENALPDAPVHHRPRAESGPERAEILNRPPRPPRPPEDWRRRSSPKRVGRSR